MAGLLDIFDNDQARFGLGLLAAAGPQERPMSFGQRMAGAVAAFDQQKRAEEERRAMQAYREMQTEALRQQAAERQMKVGAQQRLQEQLMAADPSGRLALMGQLDPQGAAKMLAPQRPQVGNIDPSKFTPQSVARFSQTGDFNVLQPVAPTPAAPAPTQLERLQALRAQLTPDDPRMAEVNAAIRKETQFAPPTQIQVGLQSPVPYQLPNGQVGYIQPPNRPGAAPQVLEYGGAPVIRPAGGDGKVPAEIQRMNIAGATMGTLLSDYEKWLSQNNPRDLSVQMNPAARADAQALMKNIQLQFKELQGLGALTGPDVAIMESALSDPFSFKGAFYGPDGLRSQIGRARQLIEERTRATASTQGQAGEQRRNFEQPQAQPQGQPKAQSKMVKLDDGSSVAAQLGPDGNYYVTRNGKRYRVEE